VKLEDIVDKELSNDLELAAFLREKTGQSGPLRSPVVMLRDSVIGDLSALQKLDQARLLELIASTSVASLSPLPEPEPLTPEVDLGILDRSLNAAEVLSSVVVGTLLLPVKLPVWAVSRLIWGANQERRGDRDIDVEVVHTNWYWRGLRRIFRFTDEYVLRVHPRHLDVRAAHSYDAIERLAQIDANNLVLHYADHSSPDYLRSTPDNIALIIELINARRPLGPVPLEHVTNTTA